MKNYVDKPIAFKVSALTKRYFRNIYRKGFSMLTVENFTENPFKEVREFFGQALNVNR